MIARKLKRVILPILLIVILGSVMFGLTASNVILATPAMEDHTQGVTANDLKPPECSHLDLVNIVTGRNGTRENDLILGTAGNDDLDGKQGDDCIVGGAGDDNLRGKLGDDVLIGGPGTDACEGNQGNNVYIDCE